MKKDEGFKVGEMIEKYRFWIGGFLILAIVAGGILLLVRENREKPNNELRIINNEGNIENIENRLIGIENKIDELSGSQSVQTSSQPVESEQGEVAGATTQAPASNYSTGKININSASATQLDSLPGIGPAYAGRIIDYREANGGFKTIEEIENIKGIGPKTFEKLKDLITVN